MPFDVRSWLAAEIRARVVGPDAANRRAELLDSEEAGWFDADSPIQRVHADASMFIGGLRALLLQSMHPLAMAGVADHSDYRSDPWGRLQRTADFIAATTFGPASEAERAVETVLRVHERVRGVVPDGRQYSANDPHLLAWVHVAEVDSFLAAHDRFGKDPLVGDERDVYVAQCAVIADALGAENPPRSEPELRARLREFRPELHATPAARNAARYLVLNWPLPLAVRPAYGAIAAAAVSLMPVWTRVPLRLPLLPITETLAVRPAGRLVTETIRWALPA